MKVFKLTLLACLLTTTAFSQNFYHGARIEAGQGFLTQVSDSKPLLYVSAGGVGTYEMLPWLDLNVELAVGWQGARYSGVQEDDETLGFEDREPYDGQVQNISLKIPLYPAVHAGGGNVHFRFFGGPELGFNFFARESRDYDNSQRPDTDFTDFEFYDPLTFAVVFGTGLRIKTEDNKMIMIDVRYSNGLSDFMNFEYHVQPVDARFNYYSISASYMLGK